MVVIDTLLEQLHRNWGWFALRGVVAVLFGVLAFAWPGLTLLVLTMFWGLYALIDGIFALVCAFRAKERDGATWPFVLVGLIGIAAGLATFMWPGMTAIVLLTFIAFWAIATGIFQIVAAIRIRKAIDNEWMLILSGMLSVFFGGVMLVRPGAGALAVVWTIAAYSIAFGLLLLALSLRLRKIGPHYSTPTPHHA